MSDYIQVLLICCPLVFIAGFVDSIAGGGGLITMPAYILAGLPIHATYGTNKFVATIGGTFATVRYAKGGHIRWRVSLIASSSSLLCAWLGAKLVLLLSEDMVKLSMMILLPIVALFLLTRKDFGGEARELGLSQKQETLYSLAIGVGCGFYDGIFGPGTGTFLLLGFSAFLGFDMVTSSGCAKVVNFASNLGSFVAYLFGGQVLFAVGIPAAVCSAAGNWLGARCAIKGGSKLIKPVILIVVAMLLVKIAADLFM